ncbi:MAG: protein kinase [bacterium]
MSEKIGEGSFGEVYLAMDPALGRKVAVKFLRLDSSNPHFANAVALFKREFELLRELKHPHLAAVHDFGLDPQRNQYFFSAEYCPGKTLYQAFQGREIGFLEDVLAQVLSALDYIHSQGVIHSDIKPENIMIEEREGAPFAKLMDFGVAGRLRSGGQQGIGGTPAYMAPELFGSNPRLDPRTDLYSLGMLLLELVAGKTPFERGNVKAATDWHLHGKIPEAAWQAREFPGYLRELIEKLLKKNPSERFSNARVVLNFLNLATSGRYQNLEAGLGAEISLEGPLVERREEVLEGLQKRIQSVFDPEAAAPSGVCFLSGERGIGKSRLLEELRQFLAVKEIPTFWLQGDWEIPAWPRLAEGLGLPDLAHDNLDREWQKRRRADALREAAKQRPLCLLIDDYHKIDKDMQDCIQKLAAEPTSVPLFIIAAGETEVDGAIRLKRLSANGVLQYVQGILGRGDRTPGLADLLYRYSGGLPLLVVEGLRFLAPRFLRGERLEGLSLSSQIVNLYQDKIESLAEDEKKLVRLLALLFRPVTEAELTVILGATPAELGALAKPAVRHGLILERTDAGLDGDFSVTYQLHSQALATSLIEGLEPEVRKALHAQIARGLEAGGQAPLKELAYHLAKAGQVERAADCYEEAAKGLQAQGQVSSAARSYSKALQLLPEGSARWQELLTELVRLYILSSSYVEAEEALKKLENTPSWRLDQLRGWLAFKRRDFPNARRHYEAALGQLGETQGLDRILVENAMANVDLQDGKPGEAALRFQKTLAWEGGLSPEEKAKINNNNLGLALVLKGDDRGAIEFYERRSRELENQLKPEERIVLFNSKSYVFLQTSRYEEAISCLKQAMRLAEETGAMHPLSSIMGNLITALIKESRYAESLPLLQKIVAFQERLGNSRDVAYNLMRQGSVYLTLGIGEKAKHCLQEGRKFSGHSDKNLELWYLLVEGYWEREHGSLDAAMEIFRKLEAGAREIGAEEIAYWGVYSQADLAFEQGKLEESRRLLATIPFSTQDKEFLARLHLLEAKLSASEKGKDPEKLFAAVESECQQGHFREILWELYHDWALTREKRAGHKAALPLYEQGVHIVEAIVGSLPEEYRDRYMNQRLRKKLFDDWKQPEQVPLKRMASRLKEFLRLS